MKKNMSNSELVQKKIKEILEKCSSSNYIFRGEPQEYEKVSSGLYRQHRQSDGSPLIDNKYFSVFAVEKDIVEEVKRHIRPDALNIEVLTELQHYRGKTTLLDFSKDIHIALFFACDGNFDKDGRVIFFKKSNFTEATNIDYKELDKNQGQHIYTLVSPTGKSPRVIFQSSIFVHVSRGYLEEGKYEDIKIEKDIKKPLLEYLSKHFNIKTETVYNDIQGFISNQDNYSNAKIEFYRGYANQKEGDNNIVIGNYDGAKGDYGKAIKKYDEAIKFNPEFAEAYNNRGISKVSLGKHKEAITDYNRAIELNPQFAEAYSNRGAAKVDLGEYKKAIKDYNRAIELNPQYADAYFNRGIANHALKQYPKAIEDYTSAKRLFELTGNIEMAKKCEEQIQKIKL